MKIETTLRHFPESSAMTREDINAYLEKKLKFMKRNVDDEEIVEVKIKRKNPRITEETKLPKIVYEVRCSGKLKTGQSFFYTEESVDLKNGIDKLANVAKEDMAQKVKIKQNRRPKSLAENLVLEEELEYA